MPAFISDFFAKYSFPAEPVLYIALGAAVLNVVVSAINGEVGSDEAVQTVFGLIVAFLMRSQVSPVASV